MKIAVVGAAGRMGSGMVRLLSSHCDLIEIDQVRGDPIERVRGATLIFESIPEEVGAKVALLSRLGELVSEEALFFSNTSSIPISLLEKESRLKGRLCGFHFFNPPEKQRLIELILPQGAPSSLRLAALEMAAMLGKVVVESADAPGFISNGHFMRELRYACGLIDEVGLSLLDQITQQLLLRPMGIFRLADFIGIKTCRQIAQVMGMDIPVLGKIERFDPSPVDLSIEPPKDGDLRPYFHALFAEKKREASIAQDFLLESREIAEQLVRDGVARDAATVGQVLEWGFGHPYGPDNDLY